MKTGLNSQTSPNRNSGDFNCLVKLISAAENAGGGMKDNPGLVRALDEHQVLNMKPDEVEFMCQKCPVTCTLKSIGGSAIALLHDREACTE